MKTVLLWLIVIAGLSLYPSEASTTKGYADKVFHAGVYAITCLLFYVTLKGRLGPRALLLSVVLATSYGLIMEIAQEMLSNRSFSVYDALANFVGAAAAALYIHTGGLNRGGRKDG